MSFKCVGTDFGNLLAINFSRDFIYFIVSKIFVDFQCTVSKFIGNKASFIRETVLSCIPMTTCVLDIIYFESVNLFRFPAVFIIVISESFITDILHACGNCNLFKRCAPIECSTADIRHTVRHSNTCQLSTTVKCVVVDFGNLFAVNVIWDFICRTVSCVFGYSQRTVIKLIGNKTRLIRKIVFSCVPVPPCILDIVYLEVIVLLCFRAISIIVKSESFITDIRHTCRNCNLFKRCTVIECMLAYLCHAVRYRYTCKA